MVMIANNRRRGFLSVDATIGLTLIGVLALAVVSVASRQNAASLKLAESRRAMRAAEQAMADLQAGRPPQPAAAGTILRVRTVPLDDAPAGRKWVRVDVELAGAAAELFGLVPAAAADVEPPAPQAPPATTGTTTTRGAP